MRRVWAVGTVLAICAISPLAHAGDAAEGENVFKKCKVCHEVESDKNKVGPTLQGVIGRTPGTVDGFRYSNAMKAYGESHVWDEATLAEYLAEPRTVVKGSRMAFPGLKKQEDIDNVIAYLKQFSQQ